MATVKIEKFCGLQPRVNAAMLADGMATVAHNCRLKSGKLVPLREPRPLEGAMVRYENGLGRIEDANSIWAWKQTAEDGSTDVEFLAFAGQVWFANSNIADDPKDRLFVSGETGIAFTDSQGVTWPDAPCVYMHNRGSNTIERMCLCKNPLSAPVVERNMDEPVDTDKDVKFTFFFVTWVDAYGYESGVSAPSRTTNGRAGETPSEQTLEYNDGDMISIAPIADVPSAASTVRVYKVVSGSGSQAIQFVYEMSRDTALTGTTFRALDENAGEALPQLESPPGDLVGIVRVPGNFYAGFIRSCPKSVAFSEIDIPTSWPYDYRYDVEDNVVALASTVNTVYALTDGKVFVLNGTAPETMTISKLSDSAPCVSARSVCVYQNAVYFAGNDGLMMVYSDSDYGMMCKNLTEKMMTKEQWRALNPSSCICQESDGELHLFFERSSEFGLMERVNYNVNLNESACAITTSDEVASCACRDERTGKMYYVREGV